MVSFDAYCFVPGLYLFIHYLLLVRSPLHLISFLQSPDGTFLYHFGNSSSITRKQPV